jgi:hypothetical protein
LFVRRQRRVDRHEVALAVHDEAVASEIDDRPIRVHGLACEGAKRTQHRVFVRVLNQLDVGEAQLAQ